MRTKVYLDKRDLSLCIVSQLNYSRKDPLLCVEFSDGSVNIGGYDYKDIKNCFILLGVL